jgi:hypothetical protein
MGVLSAVMDIALAHASLGREVFPFKLARARGSDKWTKTPLVRWTQVATTDEDQIRKWSATWPRAAWGWKLPLGSVVVDIDDADAFSRTGLTLPATACQTTVSGGSHHLYTGVGVRQTVKAVPGIDTRVGGKGWVGLYSPDAFTGEVALAPDWLLEVGDSVATAVASADVITTRHEITRLMGGWRRLGMGEKGILAELRDRLESGQISSSDPSRPWLDADLIVLAKEAAKWTPAPPVPDAPLQVRLHVVDPVGTSLEPLGIDAVDLLEMEIPPLVWAVEGLVPAGTTILASEPKIGKSWLAYQMCVEVALGGKILGRPVSQGAVLYYALEDGSRRGQNRLRTALAGRRLPRGLLEVRWGAPKIGKGLEQHLETWLDSHATARLVIIDTLQKVRPVGSKGRGMYELDVEDMGRVQNIFRDRPVALVVVHHTRKLKADDFLASVSGSYGVTGSADTTLILKRKRLEQDGSLDIVSREVIESEIPVHFDVEAGLWTLGGLQLRMSGLSTQIVEWLTIHGPAKSGEIALGVGRLRVSVQRALSLLVDEGTVEKDAESRYSTRAQ